MRIDPLDPFGGVTLASLRASLELEAASGRGPGCPARLAQADDERRELARLAEWYRDHPERRPFGWTPPTIPPEARRPAAAPPLRLVARHPELPLFAPVPEIAR